LIVIPARGGSKRLPRKNVLPLGGKPLLLHTVDAALAAAPWAQVVVSTDDPEIKAIAQYRSGVTVEGRSADLATDTAKNEDVLGALLAHPAYQNIDAIGMLLPTCPLRTAAQTREAFESLETGIDSVVSFTCFEFPAQLAVTFDAQRIMAPLIAPSPLITGNFRTQDQAPTYRPNGAVYFSWTRSFRQSRSFYTGKVKGYIMPRINSVDIDVSEDFAYAQYLIDSGQVPVTA
jgi:CMP-N-acetylneuraminic acid synthetase